MQVSTDAELERALADLGAGDEDFAILTREDGALAQAAGSRKAGFVLEVSAGSALLQSRRRNLSHEEVLAAFADWLAGGDCRTAVELLDPDASDAAAGWIPMTYRHVLIVVAIALVVAGIAFDPRDPEGTVSLEPTAYRWQGTVLLFVLAALILLFAAKMAHDISRRDRRRTRPSRPG